MKILLGFLLLLCLCCLLILSANTSWRSPSHWIDKFTNKIQDYGNANGESEKSDTLWPVEHGKYRIDPFVGVCFDTKHPAKINSHYKNHACHSRFATRIVTRNCHKFNGDENHDVCVNKVVQPEGEKSIRRKFIKNVQLKWRVTYLSTSSGITVFLSISIRTWNNKPTFKANGNAKVAKK